MAKEEKIICIGCPLGCSVNLTVDDKGEVTSITGNKCKEGEKYALDELRNPVRVLTATVLTEGSAQALLPVRTNKPIPKNLLLESMRVVARVKVKPPVKAGQVLLPNLLESGADLISTADLLN